MQEYGNVDGLLEFLHHKDDPALRARAARALGQMGELEVADALTGAALNDPDPGVCHAARLALHDLLGDQAELALKLAGTSGEDDESWCEAQVELPAGSETTDEGASPIDRDQGGFTDYQTLRGLIIIARSDPNHELRLRAIQALATKTDLTAIHALAELTLWDEDEGVRVAAETALRTRFGDRLPEVLEGYRQEMMGDQEEEEFEDVSSWYSPFSEQEESWETPSVHKKETASIIGCLLLVFIFFATLYLIFR